MQTIENPFSSTDSSETAIYPTPRGFRATGYHAGFKESGSDFAVLYSDSPATAAAVFTRNNFPGHPVVLGREIIRRHQLQAIIINSGNSNVATGAAGRQIAEESCRLAAESLAIELRLVLPSSTGVIGRLMKRETMASACRAIPTQLTGPDFKAFAQAIMTTDNGPKLRSCRLSSGAVLTGSAKGAGMIEPNMATMLAYFASDVSISAEACDRLLRSVTNRSFNRISVDSDTSTSDTVVLLANGQSGVAVDYPAEAAKIFDNASWPLESDLRQLLAGLVDETSIEFLEHFAHMAVELAQSIARDGEGATRLLEVRVHNARDRTQALKIGRSIVNSPLIKTAIYGGDPNWGRIIMAIGKVFDEPIDYDSLSVEIGPTELKEASAKALAECERYLKSHDHIVISVSLGCGSAEERLWGCDLNETYIHINADYTT